MENKVITILKGRNTVIAFPDGELIVNEQEMLGLAKGGTGDTLTGMLFAFLSSYQNVKLPLLMPFIYMVQVLITILKKKQPQVCLLAM